MTKRFDSTQGLVDITMRFKQGDATYEFSGRAYVAELDYDTEAEEIYYEGDYYPRVYPIRDTLTLTAKFARINGKFGRMKRID